MVQAGSGVSGSKAKVRRSQLCQCLAALLCIATTAHAWVLNVTPGARRIYLAVGNSTTDAANATING